MYSFINIRLQTHLFWKSLQKCVLNDILFHIMIQFKWNVAIKLLGLPTLIEGLNQLSWRFKSQSWRLWPCMVVVIVVVVFVYCAWGVAHHIVKTLTSDPSIPSKMSPHIVFNFKKNDGIYTSGISILGWATYWLQNTTGELLSYLTDYNYSGSLSRPPPPLPLIFSSFSTLVFYNYFLVRYLCLYLFHWNPVPSWYKHKASGPSCKFIPISPTLQLLKSYLTVIKNLE